MNKKSITIALTPSSIGDGLFDRVASILEQGRNNVVRSVNSNIVFAYWLIGREIVQAVPGGDRAEYGQQVIKTLSVRLTRHYGREFSLPNLKNFRQFYSLYSNRLGIGYTTGSQFATPRDTGSSKGKSSRSVSIVPHAPGREFGGDGTLFASNLIGSHYRALMRVEQH